MATGASRTPEAVAASFVSGWSDGTIGPHALATLTEVLIGFGIGATLAMMRSTSAKARVTSEKYEPLSPERKVSAPMTAPTKAPAAMKSI